MEKENKMDFRAETVAEEYAELVGRLKAFEAWANMVEDYDFTKDMALRMLGLGVNESGGEKKE